MDKIQKESLKNLLSEYFGNLGSIIDNALFPPYRLSIKRMHHPRSTYYYNLKKFENTGLIKKKTKKTYNSRFILTAKGKALLLKPKSTPKRTDGLSTIVLFDIPEEKHKERNILRRYLLRNGYIQFQKSTLIGPIKVSAELKELANELKLIPYIQIISGRVEQL